MSDVNSTAAEYGKAYFLLTEELGKSEQAKEDVSSLLSAVKDNPDYLRLLDTPALTKEERLALIDSAFAALDGHLVNLVKILCEKRVTYLLPRVLEAFLAAYDEARGIERVEAVTAIAMTEEQLARLTEKLEKLTGKQIIISNTVDPTILGGVKLRYMGVQLDGSLKTRLDGFERSLKNTVI